MPAVKHARPIAMMRNPCFLHLLIMQLHGLVKRIDSFSNSQRLPELLKSSNSMSLAKAMIKQTSASRKSAP